MPIYEYKCLNCQKKFEKLVFSQQATGIICPYCSNDSVIKEVSLCSMSTSKINDSLSSSSSSSCSGCTSKNCSSCR